ncbi:sigma-54 dependent transcriptional regulator [Chelatococcus sp. SYSU_G07232]|uniref:Sigma-54 dependent transcriptional regulator n=1 Tax=Chelatococcus albus TaxID=3047466 RepID=A0ABT7AE12_9HYPH|nr:sigma-54 dependent transcriptional regulator [Chelatococcus sp. SYSU_G07232]MDJ1157621.1 sigma-54 dependent transcriptional regulator [Chelatococcus sp. SYSU_G07232]
MSEQPFVLLIDDDAEVLDAYRQTLELEGFAVRAERAATKALAGLDRSFPGIVLTDLRMPGLDGLAVLERVRAVDPDIPVVLVTGHGDVATAVRAVRDGAYDFIEKPADPERIVETLHRAAAHRRLVVENRALRQAAGGDRLDLRLVGCSAVMARLRITVAAVAETDADVLLHGETGAGKELVARCLHDFGRRRSHHFVAINCGALPETMIEGELFGHEAGAFTGARERRIGKIEHASGGTLFLDEIESMPLAAQVRLLRVLQERRVERLGSNKEIPVDIRVVAATKRDLKELAAKGQFREDLYYRLNVVTVRLPPLRERREDIPLLFTHFLDLAAVRHGRPRPVPRPAEIAALLAHDWPGNVRELRNAAERVALGLGEAVPTGDDGIVSDGGPATGVRPLADTIEEAERNAIALALRQLGGRMARTADALGLTRKTLYLKMRRYGLDKGEFRLDGDVTDPDSPV